MNEILKKRIEEAAIEYADSIPQTIRDRLFLPSVSRQPDDGDTHGEKGGCADIGTYSPKGYDLQYPEELDNWLTKSVDSSSWKFVANAPAKDSSHPGASHDCWR